MIFVDTNVFVSAFGRRGLERVASDERAARELLSRVALGRAAATTSEAILVETTQVLTNETSGARPAPDVAAFLSNVIDSPGLRFEPKHIYLRALDIWAARPSLGFVDALTIAYVAQGDIQLASFDRQLLQSPGVTPYWLESNAPA